LSAPLAVGVSLGPEIVSERTRDGGLLMIAAEERLELTNSTHLWHSLAIIRAMIAHSGVQSK